MEPPKIDSICQVELLLHNVSAAISYPTSKGVIDMASVDTFKYIFYYVDIGSQYSCGDGCVNVLHD